MTLSVGLWDRLFGKKATLDVPDGNGNTVQRKVSVKWLREMEHQGKISLLGTPIRVHLLDPFDIKYNGYRIDEWIVGRDLEQEQYDRFKDPTTGDLYVVIAYHDGKSTTITIHKPMFVEHLAEFRGIPVIVKCRHVQLAGQGFFIPFVSLIVDVFSKHPFFYLVVFTGSRTVNVVHRDRNLILI